MNFRDRRKATPWRFDISFDTAGLVAGLCSATDLRMRLNNKGNEQADLLQHDINLCSVRPLSTRAITWADSRCDHTNGVVNSCRHVRYGGSGPANSLFACLPLGVSVSIGVVIKRRIPFDSFAPLIVLPAAPRFQ
jgi:hypothetical protein